MARRKKSKKAADNSSPFDAMIERFEPLLPSQDWQKVLSELEKPLYQAIRLNPLKSKANIESLAQKYNWDFIPVPYCENGFWIKSTPQPISKTIEHQLGHYYIQDAASMLPVELFDFAGLENPIILDMAASPGGKTTHLLAKTGDTGLVIANDSSRDRLTALRIVLQNWGAAHYAVSNYPGEKFGTWFSETFDRILLDAPCSMQGLRATDAHPLRGITQKEIDNLAKRQTKLLSSAIYALKTGGQIVYSTCTLTPEENEGVLQNIVDLFGPAIQIDEFSQRPTAGSGLAVYQDRKFAEQVQNAARLWPHVYGTAGFFAARITKLSPTEIKSKPAPARPLSQAGWHPLGKEDKTSITKTISSTYGFDLEDLAQEEQWELWTYKDSLHCFPLQFFRSFSEFPVQALGLNLGERTSEGFVISHEFVSRFGKQAQANTISLNVEQGQAWMSGQDLILSTAPTGTESIFIIIDEENRILGRGKWLGDRLRNLLPHRIRLI